MTNCTCPSGDGSLRWPCPAHPPLLDPIDEILRALDLARGQIDGAEIAPAFYNFDYLTRVMQMVRELKQPADVRASDEIFWDAVSNYAGEVGPMNTVAAAMAIFVAGASFCAQQDGQDPSDEIVINFGGVRDITIHAARKEQSCE